MNATTLAHNIGKGLVAGFAGTAAMTISSTIEQHVRGRPPSTAPADATAKVLGIERFTGPAAHSRFSNLVHWGYGTGWGVLHGVLDTIGLRGRGVAATAAHGAAVYGNAQVMLPLLQVAPPSFMWPKEEVAIDAWHHLVYATATGVAYAVLKRG